MFLRRRPASELSVMLTQGGLKTLSSAIVEGETTSAVNIIVATQANKPNGMLSPLTRGDFSGMTISFRMLTRHFFSH
jgi:hypothetical protein